MKFICLVFCLVILLIILILTNKSPFGNLQVEKSKHPFRNMCDENGTVLPIVAMCSFIRSDEERGYYKRYIDAGVKIIGVTAFKSFPKIISDSTPDKYYTEDDFKYVEKVQNWLVCFNNPERYGFTSKNNITDISESDFYDVDSTPIPEKKYDFIYSCLDDDTPDCSPEGWNYVNRNFELALKCFPIMINEFKMKILVIGRTNCGLTEKFGSNMEVLPFLPWHEFQGKLRESKYLFIPNIYDASPRVIGESLTKGLPILMNRSILCGSKYINNETGELFTDEHDVRFHIKALLAKKYNTKEWWSNNYGVSRTGVKLRNFLVKYYPEILTNIKEVRIVI